MPPKPVEPEPEPGPSMKQDIHFVLRVEAVLKEKPPPPTPTEPSSPLAQKEAGANPVPEDPGFDPPKPELDPATLHMEMKFLPWVGEEVVMKQGVFVSEEATETTPGRQHFTVEHHFKMSVDEAFVRAMAEAKGQLKLPLVIRQPENTAPPLKVAKGQPPPPPQEPPVRFQEMLSLDCSGMLVGDSQAVQEWPSKRLGLPLGFTPLLRSLSVSLRALNMPAPAQEPASTTKGKAKPGSAAGNKPASGAKKGAAGAPVDNTELENTPGELTPLLVPDLALMLNPLVIRPTHAKNMPDSPATTQQLDIKCHPTRLAIKWAPGSSPVEQSGSPTDWVDAGVGGGGAAGGPATHVRDLKFEQAEVLIAGDYSKDDLEAWCKQYPLTIEVHDRTAIPDPPEFPIANPVNEDGSPIESGEEEMDDGYVCGIARVSMLDLLRGYSNFRFKTNIVPYTTIRGAASLDWTKRPGNYGQYNSLLKGEVRCAVPLNKMVGVEAAQKVFSRVVFVMDYRDSDLFHTLEDTVRQQNAWMLGLAEPKEKVDLSAHGPGGIAPDGSIVGRSPRASECSASGLAAEEIPSPSPEHVHSTLSFSPERSRGMNRHLSMNASSVSKGNHRAEGEQSSPGGEGPKPLPRLHLGRSPSGSAQQNRTSGDKTEQSSSAKKRQGVVSPRPSHAGGSPCSPRPSCTGVGGGIKSSPSKARSSTGTYGEAPPHAAPSNKKELRFGGSWGRGSNCSSNEEEEDLPTEAELQLEAALADVERVDLDTRLLQQLSTMKLTAEQMVDKELDLLTGFHLVDGKERLIVLEGLDEGSAMSLIRAIMRWALDDVVPEEGWRKRQCVYNSSVRYPTRLWGSLGVDLYITKLRSPVTKLAAEAGSYATGQVRVDCIQGLKRLGQLRTVTWARLADDLGMFPSPDMIHLVDKKFGGELTKADVFGCEVDEFDSDEDDGGTMDIGGSDSASRSMTNDDGDARSHRSMRSARSARSGRSRRSRKSAKSKAKQRHRKHPPPLPLDHINFMYLNMREEARRRRLRTNFLQDNIDVLSSLSTMAQPLRDAWATWNPQRKAAKDLEQAVLAGTMTLQQTVDMHKEERRAETIPGAIPPGESLRKGWYPHRAPFQWPIPKAPGTYAAVAKKPSEYRIEQLEEKWVEGEMHQGVQCRPSEPGLLPMITTVRNPNGQFNRDPEFVKTVHLGGEGREKELAEDKKREKTEWHNKLVVESPVMKTTFPRRPDKPSQLDKYPGKTLHQSERYVQLPPVPNVRDGEGPIDKTRFLEPNVDFQTAIAKDKRDVSKISLNQSWCAALRDKRYYENP